MPDSFMVISKGGCSIPDNSAGVASTAKATVKLDWQGGRGSFWEADAIARHRSRSERKYRDALC
jgi:hypothetical protein